MQSTLIKINELDNVAVALRKISKGEKLEIGQNILYAQSDIIQGHKIALVDIEEGDKVIKYGYPIGKAKEKILKGMHVHSFNISTCLSENESYFYDKENAELCLKMSQEDKMAWKDKIPMINAYERANGKIGIRNELWIIPTVGCVNQVAMKLEAWAKDALDVKDGVHAFTHPYGCSQMGEDHENTRKILKDLVLHPNAGGVLVLGLGCENNTMESFKELVGKVDSSRIKFLVSQECEDEISCAKEYLKEIASAMKNDKRTQVPISRLVVGFKCGGSDGLSGITANPLVGRFCNTLVAMGGTAILTEVPEMFGAEQMLMNRAATEEVFNQTVKLINDFKSYFVRHNQVVYENPSPGNKAGGISTLEDKSLGCVQKGGRAPVEDVLGYGDIVKKNGLNLLLGPGNDIVSTTAISASGANMILFTTGRGTPLGSAVPTVKIATNTELSKKKSNWIDFNAGELLEKDTALVTENFIKFLIEIANGEKQTRNEINGYREISLFKDGVIL